MSNRKYNVIIHKLTRKVNPTEVVEAIEFLFEKYNVFYSECLLNLLCYITEFEHEGKFHSNRNRNAIKTILKRHPELERFYKHTSEDRGGYIYEDLIIRNFSWEDFVCTGEIDYSLISKISKMVPRPYAVNDLNVIYSGIGFGTSDMNRTKILKSEATDYLIGNYIGYSRESAGNEKHSYVTFSADEDNIETVRKMFFEFAEMVPGKYVSTEYTD